MTPREALNKVLECGTDTTMRRLAVTVLSDFIAEHEPKEPTLRQGLAMLYQFALTACPTDADKRLCNERFMAITAALQPVDVEATIENVLQKANWRGPVERSVLVCLARELGHEVKE